MYIFWLLIPFIHPFGQIKIGMAPNFKNTQKEFFQSRMLVALLCVNELLG